ncbi:hypothetical protein RCC89_05110 [Cytophagaceae bacterium ABcell3]|nr:hypothetical protein RCC89_05110 [Cytophagaceae bacterium ABcell3]
MIFEPSIEGEKVSLISPVENNIYNTGSITFWWEVVEGARNYRVQIVEGTFNNALNLIVDTLISKDKIFLNLSSGTYEWRVRGENGSFMTDFTSRKLVIDSVNFNDERLEPLTPDNIVFLGGKLKLEWQSMPSAVSYLVQIDSVSNVFGEGVLEERVLQSSGSIASLLHKVNNTSGQFYWRVKGVDHQDNSTPFSSVRTFSIKNSPPDLISPFDQQKVKLPVRIFWNKLSGAVSYNLYWSKKSFQNEEQIESVKRENNFYDFDSAEPGDTIYWRVSAVDIADNISKYSEESYFIIDNEE